MEAYYQPAQLLIGVFLTGGLGLGLIRLGELLKTIKYLVEELKALKQHFSRFKDQEAASHHRLYESIEAVGTRVANLEGQVGSLPCRPSFATRAPQECTEGELP